MLSGADYDLVLTELDSGLWCPHCRAPNAVGATVAIVHAPTMVVVRAYPTIWCLACDLLVEEDVE